MQLPPLAVIASWPHPNHINPETRGPANIITNVIFFLLALMVVCIRLYARIRISKSFGWDDSLIIAALFPATAFATLGVITTTKYQWDRHIYDVDFSLVETGIKLSVVQEILFAFATNLTKLSILALIYHLVSHLPGYFWKIIIGVVILIVAQGLTFVFLVLFQCGTPAAYWTLTFLPQKCISETNNLLVAGVVNTVTDLLVVILPMPLVHHLHLPTRQQFAVIILFGVGILVTLAGAARTIYLYRTTSSWDKTWMAYPVYITSSVELYIGIICASIPATKTFLGHFMPKILGSNITSDSGQSSSTEAAAVITTNATRMSSVVIGDYDGDIPLDQCQERKDTMISSRPIQSRHSICMFLDPIKEQETAPDSPAETIYELSKVESVEGLSIQRTPRSVRTLVDLSRPPPRFRQSC